MCPTRSSAVLEVGTRLILCLTSAFEILVMACSQTVLDFAFDKAKILQVLRATLERYKYLAHIDEIPNPTVSTSFAAQGRLISATRLSVPHTCLGWPCSAAENSKPHARSRHSVRQRHRVHETDVLCATSTHITWPSGLLLLYIGKAEGMQQQKCC